MVSFLKNQQNRSCFYASFPRPLRFRANGIAKGKKSARKALFKPCRRIL